MKKALTIKEASANLEKYIELAKAGKPVFIGAYGRKEVALVSRRPSSSKKDARG